MNIVYSSERGKMCPNCNMPIDECICKSIVPSFDPNQTVSVKRETKKRRGKSVITITSLPLPEDELKLLAKKLKTKLATGGSLKSNTIEIQGEHLDTIIAFLKKEGFNVKKTGG